MSGRMKASKRRKSRRFKGVNYWSVLERRNAERSSDRGVETTGSIEPSPARTPVSPVEPDANPALHSASSSSSEVEQTTTPTRSSRKLSRLLADPAATAHSSELSESPTGYRLINVELLAQGLAKVHRCSRGTLRLMELPSSRRGFHSSLVLVCSRCKKQTLLPTSKRTDLEESRGQSFDINRRATFLATQLGLGNAGLEELSFFLGMPQTITGPSYSMHIGAIDAAIKRVVESHFYEAAQRLRQSVAEEGEQPDEEGILDVAVSFDGSWMKRGFTSKYGVVCVISAVTGEVLDFHFMSKFCPACEKAKEKDMTPEQKQQWDEEHAEHCECNYSGSSPGMEARGAFVLWNRSLEKHKMRYVTMVSDGDSKAFSSIASSNPYGDEHPVKKLDCMGHVQKRMGKALITLKRTTKGNLADGKPIGGRGRLTMEKIEQLQKYYGRAIRGNLHDLEGMKKAVLAILCHYIPPASKDLAHQHRFCPSGPTSWCKWQKDKVCGTRTYTGKNCLPQCFLPLLKPTFLRLCDNALLTRVLDGYTQNPNESLHAVIWKKCPKHIFRGPRTVKIAVATGVMQFNAGYHSLLSTMEECGLPVMENSKKFAITKDTRRVQDADRKQTQQWKSQHQRLRAQKKHLEEELIESEGVTYEAGAF